MKIRLNNNITEKLMDILQQRDLSSRIGISITNKINDVMRRNKEQWNT